MYSTRARFLPLRFNMLSERVGQQLYMHIYTYPHIQLELCRALFSSRRPRPYLCGSPPVASATRRRARHTAPG